MESWDNWKQDNLFKDDFNSPRREVDMAQGADVQQGQQGRYSPLFSGRRARSGDGELPGRPGQVGPRDYYAEGTSSAPTELEGTWRSRLPPTRPRNEAEVGAAGVRSATSSWLDSYQTPEVGIGRLSGQKPPAAPRRVSRRDAAGDG